jgi:nucleotide-binding universal stress UspA family protein
MRDILLQLDGYPEPTPASAIEQAVQFSKLLGGRLSALAVQIDIRVPQNWLAERLIGISDLAEAEESKSLTLCRTTLQSFKNSAGSAGVLGEALIKRANISGVGDCVARHARTRDLCIVPIADRLDGQRTVAEDVIFGSARPTLVFNAQSAGLPRGQIGEVAIAWDGSRCAARAVADSLPLLARAQAVRVLTIINEKPAAISGLGEDVARHLRLHGIQAEIDEFEARGQGIGKAFDAYIERRKPDLLVMGAYGVSRIKEFVLGGATEYVLNNLCVPVVLSH